MDRGRCFYLGWNHDEKRPCKRLEYRENKNWKLMLEVAKPDTNRTIVSFFLFKIRAAICMQITMSYLDELRDVT